MASAKDQVQQRYLAAVVRHVSFDGWSVRALKHAANDLGEELDVVRQALPGGPARWVGAFVKAADQDMLKALAQQDLESLKIRKRIALAVRLRIEIVAPHREAVRRGVAVHAIPFNAGHAFRSLYGTVDTIWAGIGDKSTDSNFYTKRAILAGVYSSSLLYWLDDHSDRFGDTWSFLDRRIENVMGIQKTRGRVEDVAERVSKLALRGIRPSLWRCRLA